MSKVNHALRMTEGLPGRSRAAWRRCLTCDAWVIAAFTDGLVVTLTPKELDRAGAISAMQAGTSLYRLRGGVPGLLPGVVVWQQPEWLAREMLADAAAPAHLYALHPHRGIKHPQPGERRVKAPASREGEPPPF